MKITVGKYDVEIEISIFNGQPDVLLFVAQCGETRREGTSHIQGAHDSKEQQHDADVEDFANRLAVEAAGIERTREFTQKFRKEPTNDTSSDIVLAADVSHNQSA